MTEYFTFTVNLRKGRQHARFLVGGLGFGAGGLGFMSLLSYTDLDDPGQITQIPQL